jgi:hypothetical protein
LVILFGLLCVVAAICSETAAIWSIRGHILDGGGDP